MWAGPRAEGPCPFYRPAKGVGEVGCSPAPVPVAGEAPGLGCGCGGVPGAEGCAAGPPVCRVPATAGAGEEWGGGGVIMGPGPGSCQGHGASRCAAVQVPPSPPPLLHPPSYFPPPPTHLPTGPRTWGTPTCLGQEWGGATENGGGGVQGHSGLCTRTGC